MKRLMRNWVFIAIAAWGALLLQAQYPIFGPYGNIPISTAVIATNTATLTVDQMVDSALLTATPTSAAVYTTPSATALCAAFPFVASTNTIGWNYDLYLKNTAAAGSNAITWLGGTGVTFVTSPSTSGGGMRVLKMVFNSCTGTPSISVVPYGSNTF
jgi:hypothetical protein